MIEDLPALELGRVRGLSPGPTLIVIGGLHGNEPAGVAAARNVVARVFEDPALCGQLRGELVALAGNLPALVAGRRYLVRDLNRQWTPAKLEAARSAVAGKAWEWAGADPGADAEMMALVELADELDAVIARVRGPVFALDLHTTSAEGIPFAIAGASEADRAFAQQFALPAIVGMQETLDGVLTRYLASRGCTALAIEGGQSQSPLAAANLEAVVAVGLCAAGLLTPVELPEASAAHELLARTRGDLPQLIEVTLRHEVVAEREFRMEPGFATIQRVAAGTLLAREAATEIRAPFDGVVLLPLYQPQGSDGFFYGRELSSP